MGRISWSKPRHAASGNADTVPFPRRQLLILALVRISEPIAFMSVFPYVYQMVYNFQITTDDASIAIWAGAVTASYAFCEGCSGFLWGRLSDRIGRKPVLIGGLIGTMLSMLLFGLAPNIWVALLARALGGALNGNIGVINTVVAEIATAQEHEARAHTYMPSTWSIGSIIGPVIGGLLSQPADSFPAYFAKDGLFGRFPFLLPNLVCVTILCTGICFAVLFLEETHTEQRSRRDIGYEIGEGVIKRVDQRLRMVPVLLRYVRGYRVEALRELRAMYEETDDVPPAYSLVPQTPAPAVPTTLKTVKRPFREEWLSASSWTEWQQNFNRSVLSLIVATGLLAYHTISFDQLMPIYMSEPRALEAPELPFNFTGGFGMSTSTIGVFFALQGFYTIFAQMVLFVFIERRIGAIGTFRAAIFVLPALYFLMPYIVFLPEQLQRPAIFLSLVWRSTAQAMTYPAINMLLKRAVSTKLVLGSVYGANGAMASFSRAAGPAITGLLYTQGIQLHTGVLAWWVVGLVCILSAIESLWIRKQSFFDALSRQTDAEAYLELASPKMEQSDVEVSEVERLLV